MVDFFNVWDLVTSILSLGVAFLGGYLYYQLPSKKMDVLFALLDKTQGFFMLCVEQGLLDEIAAAIFGDELTILRTRSDEVNLTVTKAKTWPEDVSNMVKGLTRRINGICRDLHVVGANISVMSLRERERLVAERRAATMNTAAQGVEATPNNVLVLQPSITPTSFVVGPPDVVVSTSRGTTSPSRVACTAGDSSAPLVAQPQQQASSRLQTELLPAPEGTRPPIPICATASPEPPHRSNTQNSCSSQSSADPSSTAPTPRRKRSILAHRTRYWAPFVRQPRGRWSLQSQKSDVIELLGTSSIELVDEPEDCEWEDVPDHPLEVAVA
ncbi:hypothetical protein VTO73DRAFT_2243 [Trametes versicolor]